jgi:hypothetical protein
MPQATPRQIADFTGEWDIAGAYKGGMLDQPKDSVGQRSPPTPGDDLTASPLRFSLAQLLVATTIAAVLLAMFRTLGIYGALLSFGAALLVTLGIYPAMKPSDQPRQALMFDFVWGVVMPVVCVVFDPFVFKGGHTLNLDFPLEMPGFGTIQPPAYFAYPAIALQIAAMLAVLVVGRFPPAGAAFLVGVLLLGMFVAGAIGAVLFPLSTLGLLMLVGVLGYTPLLTAWAYGRRAGSLWRQTGNHRWWEWAVVTSVLDGFLVAAAVPAAIGWLCLTLSRSP